MLEEGKRLASARGITNIRWLCGESADLTTMAYQIGEINCTVIARAFHWMDQEQTLCDLYKITRPGGGIAIVSDSGPLDVRDLHWKRVIRKTVIKWLGEERKAGKTGTFSHPGKLYQDVLRESAFRNVRMVVVKSHRMWSIDRIMGYVYSTSYASIPVLGDKREPFEEDLRRRLAALEPAGKFVEPVKTEVIMAWK